MYANPSIMVEFDPVLLITSIQQTNWFVQTINLSQKVFVKSFYKEFLALSD